MDGTSIGERIRGYREQREISQAGLARLLGVKAVSAWRWESGRVVPSLRRLRAISEVLGVSLSALVEGSS